jgi:LmbE family N-acetylglucosaminyl deacetylase
MATLVTFHAHPDDEAIDCGGTMAKAAEQGHRVVLVVATRGEHGEVPDGLLTAGESLRDRRVEEQQRAGEILGVERIHYLGYVDSGMMGTETNHAPECFWQADPDEAAERLAGILTEESADVFTTYDEHGGYGHPDHIQVHRVGVKAAAIAGTPKVYESVLDRDLLKEGMRSLEELGIEPPLGSEATAEMGVPGELITTRIDVLDHFDKKREAMAAHGSQIPPDSFFLTLPDELMRSFFGTETFVLRGAPPGWRETDLFASYREA